MTWYETDSIFLHSMHGGLTCRRRVVRELFVRNDLRISRHVRRCPTAKESEVRDQRRPVGSQFGLAIGFRLRLMPARRIHRNETCASGSLEGSTIILEDHIDVSIFTNVDRVRMISLKAVVHVSPELNESFR